MASDLYLDPSGGSKSVSFGDATSQARKGPDERSSWEGVRHGVYCCPPQEGGPIVGIVGTRNLEGYVVLAAPSALADHDRRTRVACRAGIDGGRRLRGAPG